MDPTDPLATAHDELIDELRRDRSCDPHVVEVLARVPRERFVPADVQRRAYQNAPQPIGEGQTISQPLIVAVMATAAELTPTDRVLEIGAGSGYGAAVLAALATQVVSVERIAALVERARANLAAAGVHNVDVVEGDGTLGWSASAPYDAIVVTAAAPEVPPALLDQLADGGRLVVPVGERDATQRLVRVVRRGDRFVEQDLGGVAFVPLVGEQGWEA
jgi:protein-L-isoaspartate(D-aspartate) O-methyltransferase